MTRLEASAHQTLAVEAASSQPGSAVDAAHAAYQVADRIPSTSTSMSAQRCLTAWKLPMGTPNWTRSLAYSVASSSTRPLPPSSSAEVARAPSAAEPERMPPGPRRGARAWRPGRPTTGCG